MKEEKINRVYSNVRRYFGIGRKRTNNLANEKGELLNKKEEKLERWIEYVEKLYGNGEPVGWCIERENKVDKEELGDTILRSLFDKALKDMKEDKAVGGDGVANELIKNAGKETLKKLFQLTSRMYEEEEVPEHYQRSRLLVIPKKAGARKCDDYRTISLLSHACKILTGILHRRIQGRIKERVREDQFGFRRGRRTKEAILCLRFILEKRLKKRLDTYVAFVDLEKAFDNVEWARLFSMLREIGVKYKNRRVIWNLYKEQKAEIKVEDKMGETRIRKGVRQGCCLSPILFNLFIEKVIKKMNERRSGVSI
ncbi:hypothetical protein PGB90_003008 [Kerria lacca]